MRTILTVQACLSGPLIGRPPTGYLGLPVHSDHLGLQVASRIYKERAMTPELMYLVWSAALTLGLAVIAQRGPRSTWAFRA